MLVLHVAQPQAYESAHVPGARLVVPAELVCGVPPATGRIADAAQLEAVLTRVGYRPDQHIVVYDDEGGGWAGRMAWTLDVIGHHDWGYLNGGIHAWHGEGQPIASGSDEGAPGNAVHVAIQPERVAEVPDVIKAIEDPESLIWDVRSEEEYLGIRSGSARAGHIPGAINTDWLMLQDRNRATRLIRNLEEFLAERGITPDKHIITHCQSHHRSGLSYMVGRLLGYPDIRAYHGSWGEWGNRDDVPVEV